MTEERRRVLDMLAEGKVTVEEARASLGGAARHPPRRNPQGVRN